MEKLPSTLLLAIAAGWVIAFPSAVEAGPTVTVMSVRALVSPTVAMKFEASSVRLSVTKDDIARGYIDVPGIYRLTINTDRTLQQIANIMVDYEPNPYNFTSIQVAARTLQTGEPGFDTLLANYTNVLLATAAGPSDEPRKLTEGDRSMKIFDGAEAVSVGGTVSVRGSVTSLGYRLILPEKIKPGNMWVPLTLSLQL